MKARANFGTGSNISKLWNRFDPPNTLDLLSLTTWNGVNIFQKFLIVSLVFSHLGFWSGNHFLIAPFPDLCLLVPSCKATKTLGFLRRNLALAPRHTKEVAYKILVRPQLEYAAPISHPYNETGEKRWRKCRRQQPGGPAGDGITRVALTICWTNSSGHLWRTAG